MCLRQLAKTTVSNKYVFCFNFRQILKTVLEILSLIELIDSLQALKENLTRRGENRTNEMGKKEMIRDRIGFRRANLARKALMPATVASNPISTYCLTRFLNFDSQDRIAERVARRSKVFVSRDKNKRTKGGIRCCF